MRRWMALSVLMWLVIGLPAPVSSQGPGLFIRVDCTTITAPVTGQTWCFDATAQVLKVWTGATYALTVPSLPVSVANGGTASATAQDALTALGAIPADNRIYNSTFQTWGAGASAAPTGWSLTGTGASVGRVADGVSANFAVEVTRGAVAGLGANAQLAQNLLTFTGAGRAGDGVYPPGGWWYARWVWFGCYVKFTTTGDLIAHLSVAGAGTHQETHSANHSGDGQWHFLSGHTIFTSDITQVILNLGVESPTGAATGGSARFSGCTLVPGPYVAYTPVPIAAAVTGMDWTPSRWIGRKAVIVFGDTTQQAQGTTFYYAPGALSSATEADATGVVPFKGVARNLIVITDTNVGGAGQTLTVNVRKGGSNLSPAIVAVISTGAASAGDLSNEGAFAAGDQPGFQAITSATTGSLRVHGVLEYEEIP